MPGVHPARVSVAVDPHVEAGRELRALDVRRAGGESGGGTADRGGRVRLVDGAADEGADGGGDHAGTDALAHDVTERERGAVGGREPVVEVAADGLRRDAHADRAELRRQPVGGRGQERLLHERGPVDLALRHASPTLCGAEPAVRLPGQLVGDGRGRPVDDDREGQSDEFARARLGHLQQERQQQCGAGPEERVEHVSTSRARRHPDHRQDHDGEEDRPRVARAVPEQTDRHEVDRGHDEFRPCHAGPARHDAREQQAGHGERDAGPHPWRVGDRQPRGGHAQDRGDDDERGDDGLLREGCPRRAESDEHDRTGVLSRGDGPGPGGRGGARRAGHRVESTGCS